MAVTVSLVLSGCAVIIGKHPDALYGKRICLPCIEASRNIGVGIIHFTGDPWYQIGFGWDYEN